MASSYDAVSKRALTAITKKGAEVTFPGAATGAAIYDPATDTWSGGTSTDPVGRAVQVQSDVDRFKALGLVLNNPVTLLIAASGLAVTPAPGMTFTWAGKNYVTRDIEETAPDGVAILYKVTGEA
ncbi:MAG TPA: hypothetical protein VNJ04_06935 [Gemmatimonadaceae bacterium]|nr:hypothetical protein [Gemmatimonadaceae bacterium]